MEDLPSQEDIDYIFQCIKGTFPVQPITLIFLSDNYFKWIGEYKLMVIGGDGKIFPKKVIQFSSPVRFKGGTYAPFKFE